MDRRSAYREIKAGLWAASLALLWFGATFVFAVLYIA